VVRIAKTVLEKVDESSRETVLLEAGLLRGALKEAGSLGGSLNDLRFKPKVVSEVEVNNNIKETGGLTSRVITLMSDAGIPDDVIRYMGTRDGYVRALNNSVNPLKAARTMMAKPKFEGQYQSWLKNNSASVEEPSVPNLTPQEIAEITQRPTVPKIPVKIKVQQQLESDPVLCNECYLVEAMEGQELCLQCRLAHVEVSDTDGLL